MKASKMVDELAKIAGYMQDITCESCNYIGKPNSTDGRCPICGAMGGISPKLPEGRGREDGTYSREGKLNRLFEEIRNARLNGREYC